MSACNGLHHDGKDAVLVFPGRSERGILPLPPSPQLLPSSHSPGQGTSWGLMSFQHQGEGAVLGSEAQESQGIHPKRYLGT